MTGRGLILLAGHYPVALCVALAVPPAVSALTGLAHGRGSGGASPWKFVYTLLVYAACVPGMLAAVLTAYTLFFTRESLLDVNVLVYLAPMASMVATLWLIRRNVSFDEVPGFDRLWGLMVTIALTFAIVLAISRTWLLLVFGGSVFVLIALAAFVFALLRWAAHVAFRRRGEPRREPPSLRLG